LEKREQLGFTTQFILFYSIISFVLHMVKRLSFPIKVKAQYLNIHNDNTITINKKLKKLGGPQPPLAPLVPPPLTA
jgi:hypothetical protein